MAHFTKSPSSRILSSPPLSIPSEVGPFPSNSFGRAQEDGRDDSPVPQQGQTGLDGLDPFVAPPVDTRHAHFPATLSNLMGVSLLGPAPLPVSPSHDRIDPPGHEQDGHEEGNFSAIRPIHPDLMEAPECTDKFYVVTKGNKVGIFTDWIAAHDATSGVSGGSVVSFKTWEQALSVYRAAYEENRLHLSLQDGSLAHTPIRSSRAATPGAEANPIFVGSAPSSLAHTPIRSSRAATPGTEANPIFVGSPPSTPQRFGPLGNQGSRTARSHLPALATPQGHHSPFRPHQPSSPPHHLRTPSSSPDIIPPRAPVPEGFRAVRTTTRASTSHSIAYTRILHTTLEPIALAPPALVIPTTHNGHGGPTAPLGSTSATSSPRTIQNNGNLHGPSSSRSNNGNLHGPSSSRSNNGNLHGPSSSRSSGHRSKAKFTRDEFDGYPWPGDGLNAAGLKTLDELLNQPVDIPPRLA